MLQRYKDFSNCATLEMLIKPKNRLSTQSSTLSQAVCELSEVFASAVLFAITPYTTLAEKQSCLYGVNRVLVCRTVEVGVPLVFERNALAL